MELFPFHIPFEKIASEYGTPLYILDLDEIEARLIRLKKAFPPPTCKIFYSIKANPNPVLLQHVLQVGLGVDVCSPGDLWLAESIGFQPENITFTGVALSGETLCQLHSKRIVANLDSASELKRWCALKPSHPVGLRVASEVTAGFSPHCQGGQWGGKLGVALDEVEGLMQFAKENNVTINGLHAHIGSGILVPGAYYRSIENLLAFFLKFDQLEYVNLGGGFGTSYHDDENEFPLEEAARILLSKINKVARERGRPINVFLEPGEFIAAPAGYILTRAVVKKTWQRDNEIKEAIIVDASMNHFPGGVLYGSMNRIFHVNNPKAKSTNWYRIYGNTNQSGDSFGSERLMPEINEGDLLVLGSCGAYAASRASNFNEHLFAPEVIISQDKISLAVRKQTYQELFGRHLTTDRSCSANTIGCQILTVKMHSEFCGITFEVQKNGCSYSGELAVDLHSVVGKISTSEQDIIGAAAVLVIAGLYTPSIIQFKWDSKAAKLSEFSLLIEMLYDIRAYCAKADFFYPEISFDSSEKANETNLANKAQSPDKTFADCEETELLLFSGGIDSTYALLKLLERGRTPITLFLNINTDTSMLEQEAARRISHELGVKLLHCNIVSKGIPERDADYDLWPQFGQFPYYNSIPHGRDIFTAAIASVLGKRLGIYHIAFGQEKESRIKSIDYKGKKIYRHDVESAQGNKILTSWLTQSVVPGIQLISPIGDMTIAEIRKEMLTNHSDLLEMTQSCFWNRLCCRCVKCVSLYVMQRSLGCEVVKFPENPLADPENQELADAVNCDIPDNEIGYGTQLRNSIKEIIVNRNFTQEDYWIFQALENKTFLQN